MASLIRSKDKRTGKPNKSWRIQFMAVDGSKQASTIRFSDHSAKQADSVFRHIEGIIQAKKSNTRLDDQDAGWLGGLPDPFFKKLVNTGLIEPRIQAETSSADEPFAEFVERYVVNRRDVKPGTTKTWGQAINKVRNFFGSKTIGELTAKDGKDFLRWLKTPKSEGGAGHLGETPSKHLGHVRSFLNEAVDAEIIAVNPFRSVKAKRTPQQGRRQMIAVQDVLRVIDKAPDAEMRAIIALSFWGGLRTPSEHFVMKWSAIRWDENMMTVHSPETEGVGKPLRETPLFPELLPYLLDLYEVSEHTGPEDFVVQRRRQQSDTNLRARMRRLCIKAGVKPWPKIFQNLRSTRQTILEQFYPRGTVCEWMGNTDDVAESHYIQEMKEFRSKAATELTTDIKVVAVVHPTQKSGGASQWASQKPSDMGGTGANGHIQPNVTEVAEKPIKQVLKAKKQGPRRPRNTCPSGSGWESNPPSTR